MGFFDIFKKGKKVKCPECGRALGTEDEIRAMISRHMGGIQSMFKPGASISVGTFTTDCPFCHRKIPLSV
jgi:endogenous inhibitor of DNA gyrase (YacG/DUF329 family)